MSVTIKQFSILFGKSCLGGGGIVENRREVNLRICRVETCELRIHFYICSFDVNLLRGVFRTQSNIYDGAFSPK